VLRNRHLAGLTDVGGRLRESAGFITLPAKLLEAQPLPMAAMRARHKEAPLVRCLVLPLDGADAGNRRRRHDENLPSRKSPGAGLRQCHGIALTIDVDGITIDLVEEEIAYRHRAQADRAVSTCHHQHAAPEFFGQDGIARVATPGWRDQFTQDRRFIDQRIDPLLGVALGHFHGWPDRHHRTGGVMNHVTDPVAAHLGCTQLSRFHEHHALDQRGRRQTIHDLLQVRGATGAPAPRFRGGLRGQHAVPV